MSFQTANQISNRCKIEIYRQRLHNSELLIPKKYKKPFISSILSSLVIYEYVSQTKLNKIRKKLKTLTNTLAKSKEDYDDLLTESMTRQAKNFLLDQRIEELSEKIKDFDKREAKVKSDHKKEVKEIIKKRDLILEAQEDKILNLEGYIAELKKTQQSEEKEAEEEQALQKSDKLPVLTPAKSIGVERGPSLVSCPYPLVGKRSKGSIESSLVKQISREDVTAMPTKVVTLGKSSSVSVLPNLTASSSIDMSGFNDIRNDVDITLHEVAAALSSSTQHVSSSRIPLQHMSSQTELMRSDSDTVRRLEPKSRPIGAVAAKLDQVKRVRHEMRTFNFFAEFVNKLNKTCDLPNVDVELSTIDEQKLKTTSLVELRKIAKEFCEASDQVKTRALDMVERTMRRNKVEVKYIQEKAEQDKPTLKRMLVPKKTEEELSREESNKNEANLNVGKSLPLEPILKNNSHPAEVQSVILRNKSQININFPQAEMNSSNFGINNWNKSNHQMRERRNSRAVFHQQNNEEMNQDRDDISICSMAETALDPACVEFAVDWVERLKNLPQAPVIFDKLEKITLLEGRRKSMKTEFNVSKIFLVNPSFHF